MAWGKAEPGIACFRIITDHTTGSQYIPSNVARERPHHPLSGVGGDRDADALVQPCAHVVLKQGYEPSEALANELKAFIEEQLVPFKYSCRIELLPDLPTWQQARFIGSSYGQPPTSKQ
jgi:acyl-coenzyme A synthetase/AMP-(fatty) acid ligase